MQLPSKVFSWFKSSPAFLTFSFLRAASLYLQGENPAISGSIVQNIEMKNLGNCESPVTFVGEIINSQAQPTQSWCTWKEHMIFINKGLDNPCFCDYFNQNWNFLQIYFHDWQLCFFTFAILRADLFVLTGSNPGRSYIWRYATKHKETSGKVRISCNICGREYSSNTATGTIMKHLRGTHDLFT